MQPTSSVSAATSPYDAFLFAQIGEDSSGLPISVLSALARMDLDPWKEAGELADLPADAATRRLANLFSVLPDHALVNSDRTAVATGLVALLHRLPPMPRKQVSLKAFKVIDLSQVQLRTYALVFALSVFLFLLLSRFHA